MITHLLSNKKADIYYPPVLPCDIFISPLWYLTPPEGALQVRNRRPASCRKTILNVQSLVKWFFPALTKAFSLLNSAHVMKKNTTPSIVTDLERYVPTLIRLWQEKNSSANKSLSESDLKHIAATVKELSAGLTGERELIGSRYLSDSLSLGAYLLYFWQMSYLQIRTALRHLPQSPKNALDLGCGPGPVSCALADIGADVCAADYSKDALTLARSITDRMHKKIRFLSWDAKKHSIPDGHYDCITMSHLINELWDSNTRFELRADLINNAGKHLTPQGAILIVEPALLQTSRETLQVRDELTRRGWHIHYPCPGDYSCPALSTDSGMCHTAFPYDRSELLDSIIRYAGFKKEFLTMTMLIISRNPLPKRNATVYRIVSDIMHTKNNRMRFLICGDGIRQSLSIANNAPNELLTAFKKLHRGDLIAFQDVEIRENGLGVVMETKFSTI